VRASRVGLCLIADDRTKRKFQPIAMKGCDGVFTDTR